MHDPYHQQEYNPYAVHDESYKDYQTPIFGNSGATKIRVKHLLLVASGEYEEQFRRPWVSNYNRDNAMAIHDAVAQTYHLHQQSIATGATASDKMFTVPAEVFAGVSSSFIEPSSRYERKAHINVHGGWGQQTARFMMVIEITRNGAVTPTECILIGYTDHLGITSQGHVDHRMEFNINTMFEVRTVRTRTAYGIEQASQQLVQVNQILVDDQFAGIDDTSNPQSIRMRPYDLMSSMMLSHTERLVGPGVTVTNSITRNTSTPVYSNQSNTNPNAYMAKVLSGLVSGKTMANLQGREVKEGFQLGMQSIMDASTIRDPFLTAIKNFSGGSLTNKFTFRDLLRLDPNAERDDICYVQWRESPRRLGANVMGENMHIAGTTSPWHGSDRETQVAVIISNTLPSLMADLALRSVSIFASNKHFGPPVCYVTNPLGILAGVDMTSQALMLQQQLQMQLIDVISYNGQIPYEVQIQCDLAGEIWIKLQLDGNPENDYVVPAYASSQMSPVMTTTQNTLDTLAESFHALQQEALPVEPRGSIIHSIGHFNAPTPRY